MRAHVRTKSNIYLVVIQVRGPSAAALAERGVVLDGRPEHGHGQKGSREAPQAEGAAHSRCGESCRACVRACVRVCEVKEWSG